MDGVAGVAAGADGERAGVADAGSSSVGAQCDPAAGLQVLEHGTDATLLSVRRQRLQSHMQVVGGEQDAGPAGVLGIDNVDAREHPERAQGDVLKVADRRCHDVQPRFQLRWDGQVPQSRG